MRNIMFASCQWDCRCELNPASGEVRLLLIMLSLWVSTAVYVCVCVFEHAAVIFMAACTYRSHKATIGSTYVHQVKSHSYSWPSKLCPDYRMHVWQILYSYIRSATLVFVTGLILSPCCMSLFQTVHLVVPITVSSSYYYYFSYTCFLFFMTFISGPL